MDKEIDLEIESLKDVPTEDIPDMLFKLEGYLPLTIHVYEYIKTILKWKRKQPLLKVAILAPGGDYKLGIIFFTIYQGELNGSMYCHDDKEKDAMQRAIAATKKFPIYNHRLSAFTCLTDKSYEAIKPSVANWLTTKDPVLWLPWYCAMELKVQIPSGVEIRKLSPENADQINEIWPHKYPGSREMIAEIIKTNFGLGVFRKDSLLSWAIHWFHGGIGALHTVENERRKGYGRAVLGAMIKILGEMQINVHGNIVQGNEPILAILASLGFRHAFDSHWVSKVQDDESK